MPGVPPRVGRRPARCRAHPGEPRGVGRRARWTLLNAAPDLRAQIAATDRAAPAGDARSPIEAVVLTGGEIDQTAGLLSLRERRFALHDGETLGRSPPIRCSARWPPMVTRRRCGRASASRCPAASRRRCSWCRASSRSISKAKRPETDAETRPMSASSSARRRAAGLRARRGAVTPALRERLGARDVVLFDGTLFVDDEMIRTGTGEKTGRRMGHMPIDGADGSLAALDGLGARRIFIHINNTNPILVDGSPERRRGRSGRMGGRRGRHGDRAVKLLTPTSWKPRCATSARGAIIACIPFMGSCTAASAPRARCRPGRSIATTIRRSIPLKDASLIARCEDSALRREWRSRLVDHDGASRATAASPAGSSSPTASASIAPT